MHELEKLFAAMSLALDRREERKHEDDLILSIGMLVNPEVASQALREREYEQKLEELTPGEREMMRKNTQKRLRQMDEEGKLISDPGIQKLIRSHKATTYGGGHVIQTLSDLVEEVDDGR